MCCQVNGITSSGSKTSIPEDWAFLSMISQLSLAIVHPGPCLPPGQKLKNPADQQPSRSASSLQAIKDPFDLPMVSSALGGCMGTIFLCKPVAGSHSSACCSQCQHFHWVFLLAPEQCEQKKQKFTFPVLLAMLKWAALEAFAETTHQLGTPRPRGLRAVSSNLPCDVWSF